MSAYHPPSTPLRLGFPVKVVGVTGLKSNDARRWQSGPHLRVSLEYLHGIFDYLEANGIAMYRMASDLAPYVTHPDLPQFHGMIRESRRELQEAGRRARELGIRLSFHPSQYIVMNSPDESLVRKSMWDLESQAELLDSMELGPEAVLVIHVGGVYGDRQASCERWARTFERLSARAQARLVLENDDIRFSAADVLWVHSQTGVRLVFDHHHFWCFNPERMSMSEALERMLDTWPPEERPKIHFSSPSTALRQVQKRNPATGRMRSVSVAPVTTHHADLVHPFEFATFMRQFKHREFDVMLESKAKDAALLRLRRDLLRYAPDVAVRFGLHGEPPSSAEEETELVASVDDES